MGEYTTGDIDLKVKITSEKDLTIDDIVNEATQMWKITKSRKLKSGDLEAADALMNEFRKTNPEFCKSYPIVLRYMVQMQEFEPKALNLYLRKIKEHPWKDEKGYLDSQADYVVLLYKATHSRWNKTQVSKIWNGVRNMLQRETEIFKQYLEEYDREVSAQEEMLKKGSIDELKQFVEVAAATIESHAGTVRTETDLKGGFVDVDKLTDGIETSTLMSADELLM